MDVEMPKFMETEYIYYDDDGLKIKDNAPKWVKDEYKEFMELLNSEIME